MKRILIICFATLIGFNANATLLHYGLIGGPSSTWLLNSNVSNIGEELNYKSSMGGGFGLSVTHNFVEKIGVRLDIMYSMHNQGYTGTLQESGVTLETYTAATHLSYLDLPLMFHLGASNGFYFEVGPQFGFLLGAKEDLTWSDATLLDNRSGRDIKSDLNSMNIAAVLGLGYNVSIGGLFSLDLGIRLGYGLTDVTKTFTQADMDANDHGFNNTTSYPNDHGFSSIYAHSNSFYHDFSSTKTSTYNYTSTSRVFGSFLVGVNMKLP